MNAITLTRPDTAQVLRYMGTPPERADNALIALAEDCGIQLLSVAQPRWTYGVFSVTPEEEGVRLASGLLLRGQSLREHLAGCGRVCVLCATLGSEVDRLIRQTECTDLTRALALDCSASALAEQLCDRVEQQLQARFPGCFFPYRFSPGYGDLPLDSNTALLDLLDAPLKIGLCATPSQILTPRKSVTALLGVSDHPIESHKRSCLGCPAHDSCLNRKTGGHCGIS